MNQIPDLQFGLPESELVIARKALGVAEGEPLTVAQLRAWRLTKDTYLNDLWTTYHGSAAEQTVGITDQPQVVSKRERSMARFRR